MTIALAVVPAAAHAPVAATMVVPAVVVVPGAAHAPVAVRAAALTEAVLEADPSSMIGVATKADVQAPSQVS